MGKGPGAPTASDRRARRGLPPLPERSRSERIIARVLEIPEGFVRTYGDIEPGAPRAVGRVLARLDGPGGLAPGVEVPWHRVVRADGSAPVGEAQLELLRREDVPMRGARVDLRRARMPSAAALPEPERGAKGAGVARPRTVMPDPASGGPHAGVARPRRAARVSPAQAARVLAARDPVLARLLAAAGPPRLRPPQESHFAALVRAIVYQQLAGAAAAAIHARLLTAVGPELSPAALDALPDASVRAAGLSANKLASLRDLATKVLDGTVDLSPRGLSRASDAEVAARLVCVRGIGPWTADMFLLFQLRRLDVWPTGDLGVRRGYGLAWDVPMPSARALQPLGDPYRPYRSIVAWYCWRAAELYARAADSALTR